MSDHEHESRPASAAGEPASAAGKPAGAGDKPKRPADKKAGQHRRGHPWRDNIEAVTVSIITIVLFKYFILEAYKIPTGSMQPTLMGNQETGIFDRVLVDKLSYHLRDPARYEIVVFKYPLDSSKNFIKRIVGMPGEEFEIRHGDLFRRDDKQSEWEILRRPRPVQRSMLKRLDSEGEWAPSSGEWTFEDGGARAAGPGEATFPRSAVSVIDRYADGYPGKMASKLRRQRRHSSPKEVGDLRVQGRIEAQASCSAVNVVLSEGARRYTMILPGPAAAEDARPRIVISDHSGRIEETVIEAREPWRLPAGRAVAFGAQNLDDLLELEVDGEVLAALEVPAAAEQRSQVVLRTEGGGASFHDLAVFRDVYYLGAGQRYARWSIPEDSYLMLGDNTQDSSDGRDWQLASYRMQGDETGVVIRGNHRQEENPRFARDPDGTRRVFLHDELGERRDFPQDQASTPTYVQASFVPRGLIRGRAVVVVWPIVPSLDVYRLKWVR